MMVSSSAIVSTESIDLINWNAYHALFGAILAGFLHSVAGLFACHSIDHKPWAKKDKDRDGVRQGDGCIARISKRKRRRKKKE